MENFIFCAVWNTGNAIYFLPQMATKYDNVMVGYTFSWKYGSLTEIQNFFVKMLWYTKLLHAYSDCIMLILSKILIVQYFTPQL